MKRLMALIIFTFLFGSLFSQITYSKKLQEKIEEIQNDFNTVFQSGWIGISNDTIRINFESNGAAGDWVIIPVQKVTCGYDSEKVIFKCIPCKDTVANCIERKIEYMNNRGESSSFNSEYYLWMYKGNAEVKSRIAEEMIYFVEEVKNQSKQKQK